MKKLTKMTSFLLSLVAAFTFAVGCAEKKDSNSTSNENEIEIETGYADYKLNHGIHEYKVSQSEKKLVSNGATDYKVVIPAEYGKYEFTAMEELVYFFEDATGIKLDYVFDTEVTYSENNKYLCIGNVSFLKESGVEVTADLGVSGFKLETVGNSVYFVGGQFGPLYAVYEFLKWEFDYEYYGEDCWKIEKFVRDCELKDFKVKDVPDIPLTEVLSGNARITQENKMRLGGTPGTVLLDNYHNTLRWVPKTTYLNEKDQANYHPEFYSSNDGEQLCYTCRGNQESVKLLQDIVFNKIVEYMIADKTAPAINFEQMDVNSWCDCASCSAVVQQYGGANSATQILFTNPIGERVKEWIAQNQPGREFTILMFAYQKTVDAPTKMVDGEYVPIDGIHTQENVGIFYAPIEADYIKDFNADVNRGVRENFIKWGKVTDKLFFWSYSESFADYFVPFNTFDSVQNIYRHAYENNTIYILDQGSYNTTRASGFRSLRDYVHYKLMWNVEENVNDLMNDYFANYFGEYSEDMLEIFNSTRAWWKYIEEELGWGGAGCVLSSMDAEKHWQYGILDKWINMYDALLAKLEDLKVVSPEQYQVYYDRISLESASPKYLMCKLHKTKLSSDRLNKLVDELCSVVENLQITQVSELASTEGLRESLLG